MVGWVSCICLDDCNGRLYRICTILDTHCSADIYNSDCCNCKGKIITLYHYLYLYQGIQVHANWRNRSTGELSVISVFLAFAGTLARIFTSMQETNDRLMVVSYAAAAFMNALLFTQMIIYWQNVVKHKRH